MSPTLCEYNPVGEYLFHIGVPYFVRRIFIAIGMSDGVRKGSVRPQAESGRTYLLNPVLCVDYRLFFTFHSHKNHQWC